MSSWSRATVYFQPISYSFTWDGRQQRQCPSKCFLLIKIHDLSHEKSPHLSPLLSLDQVASSDNSLPNQSHFTHHLMLSMPPVNLWHSGNTIGFHVFQFRNRFANSWHQNSSKLIPFYNYNLRLTFSDATIFMMQKCLSSHTRQIDCVLFARVTNRPAWRIQYTSITRSYHHRSGSNEYSFDLRLGASIIPLCHKSTGGIHSIRWWVKWV